MQRRRIFTAKQNKICPCHKRPARECRTRDSPHGPNAAQPTSPRRFFVASFQILGAIAYLPIVLIYQRGTRPFHL
jgi:hypothetical protein